MYKEKNRSRGITLIALIVTIIVLIILAGVAITMLRGDNGILTRASETRVTNGIGQFDESLKLAFMSAKTSIESSKVSIPGYIATKEENTKAIADDIAKELGVTAIKAPADLETKIETEGYTVAYYIETEENESKNRKTYIVIWYTDNSLRSTMNIEKAEDKYGLIEVWSDGNESSNQAVLVASIQISNYNTELSRKGITSTADGENDLLQEKFNDTSLNEKLGFVSTSKVLTEQEKESAKGQFVKWNSIYKDAYYNTYNYTEENGWRILKIENGTEEGKYNVQIISTGIPALLYYNYSQRDTTWWGTNTTTVVDYYRETGTSSFKNSTSWASRFSGYYAAYGLNEQFVSIPFLKKTSTSTGYNVAFYADIKGLNTITDVKDAFCDSTLKSKVKKIRNIEGADIRSELGKAFSNASTITDLEDPIGLFKLENLKNILTGKTYGEKWYYIASPRTLLGNYEFALWGVKNNGAMGHLGNGPHGIRPVIVLSDVQLDYNKETKLWSLK